MKAGLAKLRRIRALTLKETRQVIRDPSSIAIGCVVPLLMILLFGYGLSLDINHVSVAVVDEDDSSDSTALIGAFRLSPYFRVTVVHSMAEANTQMLNRTVDGVLLHPVRFRPALHLGGAEVQILVNGTDANQARIMQGYAQGWSAYGARRRLDQRAPCPPAR
jgi:ABC-2 type transport system permease protein